jgi:ATP-dependent DNA ligase
MQLTPAYPASEGGALFAATAEQGLEGVVAKRLESPYRPGVRSRDWVKIKHHRAGPGQGSSAHVRSSGPRRAWPPGQ